MNSISKTRLLMLTLIGVGCTSAMLWSITQYGINEAGSQNSSDVYNKDGILQAVIFEDESAYVSRGLFPSLSVRELGTNKLITRYNYNSQIPSKFDASSTGNLIVVCYNNREVVVWSGDRGKLQPRRICILQCVPVSCSLSADGQFAVVGLESGIVVFIDLSSGRTVRQIDTGQVDLVKVCFLPIGHFFLTASNSGRIGLWDYKNGSKIREYQVHHGRINVLQCSKDGRRFVSGGMDASPVSGILTIPSRTG